MVDIDGTIAHAQDRGWYEYDKVHSDLCDEIIKDIVVGAHERGDKIILCTGRNEDSRGQTEAWLAANGIPWDELHMRPSKDRQPDSIVKKRLYKKYIRPKYRIKFVLEDRSRVVKMWRKLGLKCLQVAEGDF